MSAPTKTETQAAAYAEAVKRVADAAPPLTEAQAARIRAALSGGR